MNVTYSGPTYSINDYDEDGDIMASGIFLHFGNTRIRVADDKEGLSAFVNRIKEIEKEILETR